MGFEIWMVVNRELEEEGGDADDGEHEEVGDQEGAASVLQRDIKWEPRFGEQSCSIEHFYQVLRFLKQVLSIKRLVVTL